MLRQFENIRVAILCSHRAPGLERLLEHPQRGRLYDVGCVITSEEELPERAAVERAGVPVLLHPIREFHRACGAPLGNDEARRSYDAMTVHVLQQLDINAVLMLGYLYVATDVLLDPFPRRIFNIHDSDLTITNEDGERKYRGLRSTRDAMMAGEPETRSTLHVVTPRLDGGPIVMRSGAYAVAPWIRRAAEGGHADIVKACAWAQREWMMRDSWGEMAVKTLELVAAGEELPLPAAPSRSWSGEPRMAQVFPS